MGGVSSPLIKPNVPAISDSRLAELDRTIVRVASRADVHDHVFNGDEQVARVLRELVRKGRISSAEAAAADQSNAILSRTLFVLEDKAGPREKVSWGNVRVTGLAVRLDPAFIGYTHHSSEGPLVLGSSDEPVYPSKALVSRAEVLARVPYDFQAGEFRIVAFSTVVKRAKGRSEPHLGPYFSASTNFYRVEDPGTPWNLGVED